jgi:Restriction endonuclease
VQCGEHRKQIVFGAGQLKAVKRNTGLSYEQVVRVIFQEILDREYGQTISVEHDVTVHGIATTHQVDVMWRFTLGGVSYTTIIEAKDWESKIGKGTVLAFRQRLSDLPGQPRGLLVTKSGFQAGAKKLAETYGISLFLLKRVPAFNFTMTQLSRAKIALDTSVKYATLTVMAPRISIRTVAIGDGTPEHVLPPNFTLSDAKIAPTDDSADEKTLLDVVRPFVQSLHDQGQSEGSFTQLFDEPMFIRMRKSRARHLIRGFV